MDDFRIFYGLGQGCLLADKLFLLAGTISLTVERSGTEKVRQSVYGLPACGESIDWRDPFPNVEPRNQTLQEKGLELWNQQLIPFSCVIFF